MACSGKAVEDNVQEEFGKLCIPILLSQVSPLNSSDLFKGSGFAVLKMFDIQILGKLWSSGNILIAPKWNCVQVFGSFGKALYESLEL